METMWLIFLLVVFVSSCSAGLPRSAQLNSVESGDSVFIEVTSARNFSSVKLQGRYIHYEVCSDIVRQGGLYLIVLHPSRGTVLARRFNSGSFKAGLVDMTQFLERVQRGRIIILLVMHDVWLSVEPDTREKLSRLGQLFEDISRGSLYALIARKETHTYAEAHGRAHSNPDRVEPLTVSARVPLDYETDCIWPDNDKASLRSDFCNTYEGYGGLCNCTNPDPLQYPFRSLLNNLTFNYPIAILGSNRGSYIYRMLQTLLPNRGLNSSYITIYLQQYHPEILHLSQLLGLRVSVYTEYSNSQGGKISMNLKNAIQTSFELFPDSDRIVILEDDLYVSPDFIGYFSQTAVLLELDVTLYCVSAWNDLSYRHSSADPALLYRTSYFPGLGWMMSRSMLMGEIIPQWKQAWEDWDWDMWFRTEELTLGRECVIPDVSRTYHFAYQGGHVYSAFQFEYFSDKSLNIIPDVQLYNISSVIYSNYRDTLNSVPRIARLPDMNRYFSSCLDIFPETDNLTERSHPYVLTFSMDHAFEREGVQTLFTCFGVWDMDVRGEHRGTWRMFINKNPIIFVGIPYSEYGQYFLNTMGISPLFDFKKYHLPRGRKPSTDGSPPQVATFSTPDSDEYEEEP